MPTIHLHRTWCKTCNDWTLHNWKGKENNVCTICKTEFSTVDFSQIPEEKIVEQRQRYKQSRRKNVYGIIDRALGGRNSFDNPFSTEFPTETTEDDAGQIAIDYKLNLLRKEEIKKENALHAESVKYASLGRNDICLCGSGKKYKNCCWTKFKRFH